MTVALMIPEADLPNPMLPLALVSGLSVLLSACAQFPDLDTRTGDIDPRAPYPALVPLDPLVAGADPARITETETAATGARVAGLRARADRLRRTVIDSDSRTRMQQNVTR